MRNPLPVRDGVTASRLYLPKGNWQSLWHFLVERFPHLSADILKNRLLKGDMVNQEGIPFSLSSPYPSDSWLWYYREVEQETVVPFDLTILYQDDYLIAVDKPHFLASIPGGRYLQETALIRLRKMCHNPAISPIHRLDRDTAGVLLFCVNPEVRGVYQTLFQGRNIQKVYECIAPFNPQLSFPLLRESDIEKSDFYFTMQERHACYTSLPTGKNDGQHCLNMPQLEGSSLGSDEKKNVCLSSSVPQEVMKKKTVSQEKDTTKNSQTWIELITHHNTLAHYRLHPLTGKKHQLRVHMNGLGLPIVNDTFYPELLPQKEVENFQAPLQLLARSIAFIDPITKEQRYFKSQQQLEWLKYF